MLIGLKKKIKRKCPSSLFTCSVDDILKITLQNHIAVAFLICDEIVLHLLPYINIDDTMYFSNLFLSMRFCIAFWRLLPLFQFIFGLQCQLFRYQLSLLWECFRISIFLDFDISILYIAYYTVRLAVFILLMVSTFFTLPFTSLSKTCYFLSVPAINTVWFV